MRKITICLLLPALLVPLGVRAQGHDPGLVLTYGIITKQSVASTALEESVIGTQAAGHILLNSEVKQVTNFKNQFNDYLSKFTETITFAANLYGIYLEVDKAIKNVKNLSGVVLRCPENTIAVAFSPSKSKVYKEILTSGLQIVGDIETLTPWHSDKNKNAKMTKAERLECIEGIRKKLRTMNYQMSCMYRFIKYTTLMDSWYELSQTQAVYRPKSMKTIIESCQNRWIDSAKKVNSYNCSK